MGRASQYTDCNKHVSYVASSSVSDVKLIDNLPWERSGTRNVPVESEELHQFLQIVQEVSTCDNPTISAAIDTQFIRSTQDAFSKMVREEHWRTLTSPLPDILGCQDILTNLDARISSGGLV